MRRRTVHKARAFAVGDKIRCAEVADIIPFAVTAFNPMQRMEQLDLRKIFGGDIT